MYKIGEFRLRAVATLANVSLGLVLASVTNLAAQEQPKWLDQTELFSTFVGKTVSGQLFTPWGRPIQSFILYYHPDGRILGNHSRTGNEDGCWSIRKDEMCFAFGRGSNRDDHCWKFARSGDDLFLKHASGSFGLKSILGEGDINGLAGTQSWTCEAVTSLLDSVAPEAVVASRFESPVSSRVVAGR